jgi:hypothetical protein
MKISCFCHLILNDLVTICKTFNPARAIYTFVFTIGAKFDKLIEVIGQWVGTRLLL